MSTPHLILFVGLLLVLGFVLALRSPLPGLFPATTVPVPPGELWQLNQ